jgi:hypothetical protein
MHSLIHAEFVRASSPSSGQVGGREKGRVSDLGEARAGRLSTRPDPPPRHMPRRIAARALARAARRLDRETARKAIA